MVQTKTRKVAVFADGSREVIRKVDGWWIYPRGCGGNFDGVSGSGSSHYDSIRNTVIDAGGRIEVEPNPGYRPKLSTFDRLMNGRH